MKVITEDGSASRQSVPLIRRRSVRRLVRGAAARAFTAILKAVSVAAFRVKCWLHEIDCGSQVQIFGRVIVRSGAGKISIGNRVVFVSSSWRCNASAIAHPVRLRTFLPSSRIIFEEGSGMNGGSVTARSHTIRIGKNTMIGPDCMFVDSDFHVAWPPEQRNQFGTADFDRDVWIGDNVWLGARCIVLKGVSIGDNSVIAAGSVITKSIPANALAGGNPVRVLKLYTDASGDRIV